MSFSDLEDAFLFVSSGSPFEHSAVLCRDTGKIYYKSEFGDLDEIPEDLDYEKCVEIPHKNDLNLGKELVYEFAEMRFPDELNRVEHIFSHKEAYSRFKQMLEEKDLLDEWSMFENQHSKLALKKWCRDEGVEVTG
ncbi:MAG: hypothetical protein NTX71_09665 [Candidatus Aureabacteria bacterium]|nr:hypothetical protein [Candidatus Auribacterota bacterium]